MRKWKTYAAPDDPRVWSDVQNMWPTRFGTYESADVYDTGTDKAATGEGLTTGVSAWAFNTLSGQRCYVVGNKIWEYSGGSLTDRNGALATGHTNGHMCQYGDITIMARGTGASLVSSSGGNFAAIAGAPSAKIVVVHANAVVAFNTSVSADGWAASDVGDYTNWSTGEAASGRILENNGPITAAAPLGNDIIVFKPDGIFKMTYVGGTVKWTIAKLVQGIGCVAEVARMLSPATACGSFIMFPGVAQNIANATEQYFVFDGVNRPQPVSVETKLHPGTVAAAGVPLFDPETRTVYVSAYFSTDGIYPLFYNVDSDAWGRNALNSSVGASGNFPQPVRGDQSAVNTFFTVNSPLRPMFLAAANKFVLYMPVAPGGATSTSAYVQTSRAGEVDVKTTFSRLTPLLRRRSNGSGTPLASLTFDLFTELHDVTPASTRPVPEATPRQRFDLMGGAAANGFARFKITYADMDVEIDDVKLTAKRSGTD